MSIGKSVRLFLADGTPGGLLTAEIMNWTGQILAAPRSDLATLLKRAETKRTGIYILLGDDPDSLGGTIAYIGEGDDVSQRLYHHALPEDKGGKDFWERAIVLTSKDANITKAHARYLESRLITLAQQAHRALLVNGTKPTPLPLPEADVSDMEYFIEQAKIVLPVLGVNLLRSVSTATAIPRTSDNATAQDSSVSPIFEMTVKKDGITATAQEVDGEFTVLEGSSARGSWVGAGDDGYKRMWENLQEDGTLAVRMGEATATFTRSYVFTSPSAAAAIVAGRRANGRTEWRIQGTGTTYAEWQNRAIDNDADYGGSL